MPDPTNDFFFTHDHICALDQEIRLAHGKGGAALIAAMEHMQLEKSDLWNAMASFSPAEQLTLNDAAKLFNSCVVKYAKTTYDKDGLLAMVGKLLDKLPDAPMRVSPSAAAMASKNTDANKMRKPKPGKGAKGEKEAKESKNPPPAPPKTAPNAKRANVPAPPANDPVVPAKKPEKPAARKVVHVVIPTRPPKSPTPLPSEADSDHEDNSDRHGTDEEDSEDDVDTGKGKGKGKGKKNATKKRVSKKKVKKEKNGEEDAGEAEVDARAGNKHKPGPKNKNGAKARNISGSGTPYASPCETCYLKNLFCEIPAGGSGNCVPCKAKKLQCAYRLTPKQVGLLTKNPLKSKQHLQLSSRGTKETSGTPGPSRKDDQEDLASDEETKPRFIFDDIDTIKGTMAELAGSHGKVSKHFESRIAKLEADVAIRMGGIEKVLNALCKVIDNAVAHQVIEPRMSVPLAVAIGDGSAMAVSLPPAPPSLANPSTSAPGPDTAGQVDAPQATGTLSPPPPPAAPPVLSAMAVPPHPAGPAPLMLAPTPAAAADGNNTQGGASTANSIPGDNGNNGDESAKGKRKADDGMDLDEPQGKKFHSI